MYLYLVFYRWNTEFNTLKGVFSNREDAAAFANELRATPKVDHDEVYVEEWTTGQTKTIDE